MELEASRFFETASCQTGIGVARCRSRRRLPSLTGKGRHRSKSSGRRCRSVVTAAEIHQSRRLLSGPADDDSCEGSQHTHTRSIAFQRRFSKGQHWRESPYTESTRPRGVKRSSIIDWHVPGPSSRHVYRCIFLAGPSRRSIFQLLNDVVITSWR